MVAMFTNIILWELSILTDTCKETPSGYYGFLILYLIEKHPKWKAGMFLA